MKESMWGYLIIILGVVIVGILLLVQRLTSINEEDYYLSREVLKSSMLDAVDYGTYMKTGKLVMSREKFVAIFTRRFAESVNADRDYVLDFYDIYEYPPKATIRISTKTGETTVNNEGVNLEINTFITGILETNQKNDLFSSFFNVDGDVDGKNGTTIDDSRIILANDGIVNKDKADVNHDGKIDYLDASIIERSRIGRYSQGDINRDGKIDADDVALLKDNVTLSREEKILADVNCDGKVSKEDLNLLQKYVKGEIKSFIKPKKGDVNGDGRITALDLEYIGYYINKGLILSDEQLARANVNGTGNVDNADLKELTNWLIGKSSTNYSYK